VDMAVTHMVVEAPMENLGGNKYHSIIERSNQ